MKPEYKGKTNLTAKVCCDSLPPKEATLGIIQGVKKNIQCMYVYTHTHSMEDEDKKSMDASKNASQQ